MKLPIRSPSWERRVLAPYSRPPFTVVWRRRMLQLRNHWVKGMAQPGGWSPLRPPIGDLKVTSNPAAGGWTPSSLRARPDAHSHLSVPGCFSTSLFLSLCVFT